MTKLSIENHHGIDVYPMAERGGCSLCVFNDPDLEGGCPPCTPMERDDSENVYFVEVDDV